ncbi:MAG: bis(5'-nucleosyl)-tetraphosphatase (symmetrical) YqeK [Lachnospiraceae bacterium]|nr:bis(5'-nucleosyl)-tetraphosphatase (symmetrical) YqeK [Lachnospiraceae bacterium]
MDERIPEIRKRLKKKLTPERYEHSLSVSYTAAALAMRYGYDLDRAELAGLLHDCARQYENQIIYEKCLKKGLKVTEDEEKNKVLLHARYGSYLAAHKYGVDDPEILSAIEFHTTGRPDMSMLEKILYIADYIEPRRCKAANLEYMRRLAFTDLDEALVEIMTGILKYLDETGAAIDSQTKEACRFYESYHNHAEI